MKNTIVLLLIFLTGIVEADAQNKVEVSGVMPDSAAKTGTWTEWQSVKSSAGAEIALYRIRLASAGKFTSGSVECKYEVEVKSLLDAFVFVDLTYSYYQTLSGSSKWQDGERRGSIAKKNKTWKFEMLAFNDQGDNKDKAAACKDCDLSYKLIFNWK
ncbi:MAG: hypothetical protein RL007_688 [Bacteroidota bacterium]|jgi:hypothetical protein